MHAWYFRKPMYTNGRGQEFPIHASVDALHLDGNNSRQGHSARSTSHSICGYAVCLSPGLSRRLPFMSYVVKDAMSRRQNEFRRLTAFVGHHALGKGAAIANFIADLSAGVWLSHTMSPDTRFHNAWVGYFLELLCQMDAEERYDLRIRVHSCVCM